MDRPVFSSHGGSGAEFGPIGAKMGGKTGIWASRNGGVSRFRSPGVAGRVIDPLGS